MNSEPEPYDTLLYKYTVTAPSDNRRGCAFTTPHHLNPLTTQLPNFFLLFFAALLLQSCQPDLKVIEDMTRVDESPVMSTFNMEIIYSSGGIISMMMNAPRMDHYEHDETYIEMPEGVEVLFYDSLMNVTSSITAKYAISYGENDLVEARNDVVVINEQNERLNTEHLVWDQKKEMIFSEKFVKITREDEVLYGDGLESDERFSQWVIKRPRGTFTIETEGGE